MEFKCLLESDVIAAATQSKKMKELRDDDSTVSYEPSEYTCKLEWVNTAGVFDNKDELHQIAQFMQNQLSY